MPGSPRIPATSEASPYGRHIPALDGLRGLAVLGVAASHLFPGTAQSLLTRTIQSTLSFGFVGVDLFFVPSGFLITGILYDSLGDPGYFRKFYARRVLRIFPLYYGVLAFYALGALFFGMRYSHQLWSMALYLQNTSLIARPIYAYNGPSLLPLAHFWSLAVEEQFYLVWPLLVYSLRRQRPLLITCSAFMVLCPIFRLALWHRGWPYYPVHMSTLTRADTLLAGAALALLLRSPAHDRILRAAPWLFLCGVLLTAITFSRSDSTALSFRYTALYVTFAGLLALAVQPSIITDLCQFPPLRWFGRYSYGLYVFHLIFFAYLQEPLRAFIARHISPSRGLGVAMAGLICFAVSMLAAYASYNLYEARFLRLKRFFAYRRQGKAESQRNETMRQQAA